jgi:hypothetical protein
VSEKQPHPDSIIFLLDQAAAGAANLAVQLGGYFAKLRAEGFSRQEAFTLTMNYQQNLFTATIADQQRKDHRD